jgi:hypothetical protein
MKLPSPKKVTKALHKYSCNVFKMWQCDLKHSNTHHDESFFVVGLKFCANVGKKNEKRKKLISFLRKKSLSFQKIENHVANISLLVLVW